MGLLPTGGAGPLSCQESRILTLFMKPALEVPTFGTTDREMDSFNLGIKGTTTFPGI